MPAGSEAEFPKILSRTTNRVSPWVTLLEKSVQFGPDRAPESYHFLTQNPYVGMLVMTPDRRIPLIRQYRPCVEEFTWEFPAGTVDGVETPEDAARRELREETAMEAQELIYLGNCHPDTGRLAVSSHAFYGTVRPIPGASPEPGVSVRCVDHRELKRMINAGEFRHQLHLAIYASVLARDLSLD